VAHVCWVECGDRRKGIIIGNDDADPLTTSNTTTIHQYQATGRKSMAWA